MIICPGGLDGSKALGACKILIEMLQKQKNNKRFYCAICAAPVIVFGENHLIDD